MKPTTKPSTTITPSDTERIGQETDGAISSEIADAYRGELEQRAYGQEDAGLSLIKVNPDKSLKGDSRYKAFLRKMNLPE
jgi:hypothetical protein